MRELRNFYSQQTNYCKCKERNREILRDKILPTKTPKPNLIIIVVFAVYSSYCTQNALDIMVILAKGVNDYFAGITCKNLLK